MRYKLRSSTKAESTPILNEPLEPKPSTSKVHPQDVSSEPPEKKARVAICRRKIIHKPLSTPSIGELTSSSAQSLSSTTILSLGVDVILFLSRYLDGTSLINLYRSCHYFYDMLRHSGTFWKFVCQREELANYECLADNQNDSNLEEMNKLGWAGKPMRVKVPDDYEHWRKIYLRGLQMRRNIVSSNFEGWRIYANTRKPLAKVSVI